MSFMVHTLNTMADHAALHELSHVNLPSNKVTRPTVHHIAVGMGTARNNLIGMPVDSVRFSGQKKTTSTNTQSSPGTIKPQWRRYLNSFWQPALAAAVGAGLGAGIGLLTGGFLSVPAMVIGGVAAPIVILAILALTAKSKSITKSANESPATIAHTENGPPQPITKLSSPPQLPENISDTLLNDSCEISIYTKPNGELHGEVFSFDNQSKGAIWSKDIMTYFHQIKTMIDEEKGGIGQNMLESNKTPTLVDVLVENKRVLLLVFNTHPNLIDEKGRNIKGYYAWSSPNQDLTPLQQLILDSFNKTDIINGVVDGVQKYFSKDDKAPHTLNRDNFIRELYTGCQRPCTGEKGTFISLVKDVPDAQSTQPVVEDLLSQLKQNNTTIQIWTTPQESKGQIFLTFDSNKKLTSIDNPKTKDPHPLVALINQIETQLNTKLKPQNALVVDCVQDAVRTVCLAVKIKDDRRYKGRNGFDYYVFRSKDKNLTPLQKIIIDGLKTTNSIQGVIDATQQGFLNTKPAGRADEVTLNLSRDQWIETLYKAAQQSADEGTAEFISLADSELKPKSS